MKNGKKAIAYNANARIAEIVNMDAEMVEFMLNHKSANPELIADATEFAAVYATSDSRSNFTLNTNTAIGVIATHYNLDSLTLKIIELSIIFGNTEYFNSISDLSDEVIATDFQTNVEHVKAYRLLKAKLNELNEKSIQKVR